METLQKQEEEGLSRFQGLIERLASLKERYGDQYPIIMYEPEIESKEKKLLKDTIKGNESVHLFEEFKEALKFFQSLEIGFILIISSDFDEKIILKNFQSFQNAFGRGMFDFEEKEFFDDLFGKDYPEKPLGLKAYVFCTALDLMTEAPIQEDDVMIMSKVQDMAQKFQQEYVVIWYDPNITTKNKEILTKGIDIEEGNIYSDFIKLYDRIYDTNSPPYHLIMTGNAETEKVISEVGELKDFLLCLYIYIGDPDHLAKSRNRKILIASTVKELLPKLKKGIRENSKLVNSFPAFATDFDALDKSHLYNLHYYLKGLINFKNRKQAKEDFLVLAKIIYESKKIFEFQQEYDDYNKKEIFRWYAMESPVYKLVNNCLRIASSDSILCCRYILKDLERAVQEGYREQSYNGVVHRGAYIQKDEWEKLQKNIGKEIEMYGFLSTSENIKVAEGFLFSDIKNKILITIIIPPTFAFDEQGFADISQSSSFGEAEILFNVRSKFRILEAGMTEVQGRGCRHLILLYGPQILKKFITEHKSNFEIKLEGLERKCDLCGGKNRLFGFTQKKLTHVKCFDCLLLADMMPQDVPLFALDGENEMLVKRFEGSRQEFSRRFSFALSGYKCQDCGEKGKDKYYKWIDSKKGDETKQCSECFVKHKEVRFDVFVSESTPYAIWHEQQSEEEIINDENEEELQERLFYQSQGEVYLEVESFDLCVKYGENMIRKSKRKRMREIQKLFNFGLLGRAHERLGNHKVAKEFLLKAVDLAKIIFGEKSHYVSTSYNDLALVHKSLDEYKKALDCYLKSLTITISAFGEDSPQTAACYNNLGLLYENLEDHKKAFKYHAEALRIRKEIYGENNRETAASYNNLGMVYENSKEHNEALKCFEKALQIRRSVFGEIHTWTAQSYQNIGIVYQSLCAYKEALESNMKALQIVKEIDGENHINVVILYMNIAYMCNHSKLHVKSMEFCQKALEITRRINLENHSITAKLYTNIALLSQNSGNYSEAMKYHQKAFDIRNSLYGEMHMEVSDSYDGFGAVLMHLKAYDGALDCYKKALHIRKTLKGENHISVADSYQKLGILHQNLKNYNEALAYFLQVLKIRQSLYGDMNTEVNKSFVDLATVYEKKEDYQKALEYHLKSQNIVNFFYGDKHPFTADVYNSLATVLRKLKRYPQAIEQYIKALNIIKSAEGEKHQDVATLYHNLALVYGDAGESSKAVEFHKKVLEIREFLYGEMNEAVASSCSDIAGIYQEAKDFKNAKKYFMKVLNIHKGINPLLSTKINLNFCETFSGHAKKKFRSAIFWSLSASNFTQKTFYFSITKIKIIIEFDGSIEMQNNLRLQSV